MSDSTSVTCNVSKTRVGFLIYRSEGGFGDDPDGRSLRIRRRRWFPGPAVFTSIVTGTPPEAHEVYTWLVPTDGVEASPSSGTPTPAAAEGFRVRRSTECGRPPIWNRLADSGIDSIVVGSPFRPGGVSGVEESTRDWTVDLFEPNRGVAIDEKFAMLAESKSRCPDARFIFLGVDSTDQRQGRDDADRKRTEAVPQETVRTTVDRFAREMELDHVLVVAMGGIFDWMVYHGSRDVRPSIKPGLGSPVQTIFDLFGLPRVADVRGDSLLLAGAPEPETIEEPTVRWILPSEDGDESHQFDPVIDRIRAGEAGPIARSVGTQVLIGRWEQAFERGLRETMIPIASDLILAGDTPTAHLRLLFPLALRQDEEGFASARTILRATHPGSQVDRMIDLFAVSSITDEARCEILDENPIERVKGQHLRGLWGTSALRLGRIDAGLDLLWRRIRHDFSNAVELVAFASHSIERNQEGDLSRARFALRRRLDQVQGPERRSQLVRKIAHTLQMEDDLDGAKALLERFLRRNPGEMGATRMLDGLKRMSEG